MYSNNDGPSMMINGGNNRNNGSVHVSGVNNPNNCGLVQITNVNMDDISSNNNYLDDF